ncbi:hypothetical protein ACF0H5_020218 [Mactra antiquata]
MATGGESFRSGRSRRERSDDVELGYDVTFVQEVDKKYSCAVCLLVIRNAMQTPCGHRFCQNCIERVAGRLSSSCRCPVDNTTFNYLEEIFPDIATRREILSLEVYCNQHENGCSWTGELRNYEDHGRSCNYVEVECEYGCEVRTIRRMNLEEHLNNCPSRPVRCVHCNCLTTSVDIMKHELLMCNKFPVACSLCGKTGINREDIPSHLHQNTGDCPRRIISCPYQRNGCTFKDRHENMGEHEKENVHKHLHGLAETVKYLEDKVCTLTKRINTFEMFMQAGNQPSRMSYYDGRLFWKVDLIPNVEEYISKPFPVSDAVTNCKLRVILDLHGVIGTCPEYASLYIIREENRSDDEISPPFNVMCEVSLIPNDETSVKNIFMLCEQVPVCRSETVSERMNCRRGLSRFMPSNDLLSTKYLFGEHLCLSVCVYLV